MRSHGKRDDNHESLQGPLRLHQFRKKAGSKSVHNGEANSVLWNWGMSSRMKAYLSRSQNCGKPPGGQNLVYNSWLKKMIH